MAFLACAHVLPFEPLDSQHRESCGSEEDKGMHLHGLHAAALCCLTLCCSTCMPSFDSAEQVPYGSTFHSHLRWDAVSVGEKQTRLRVSCEVRKHCPWAAELGASMSLVCSSAALPTPCEGHRTQNCLVQEAC